jgi:hypothetical protein
MPKDTSKRSTKKKSAGGKKACTICGDDVRPQSFAAHLRKCKREKDKQEALLEYEKEMDNRALAKFRGMWFSALLLLPMFTFIPQARALRTAGETPPDHEDYMTPELELDVQPGTKVPFIREIDQPALTLSPAPHTPENSTAMPQ